MQKRLIFSCLVILSMTTSCQNGESLPKSYDLGSKQLQIPGKEIKLGEKVAMIYPFQGNESVIVEFNEKTSGLRSSYNTDIVFKDGVSIEENDYTFYFFPMEKDGKNVIVGGYGFQGAADLDCIFYFEQKIIAGNIYTLMDVDDNPIVDVSIDNVSGECRYVRVYDTSSLRASKSEWCGLGMAAVGGVAAAFSPMTLGASIGFAACWGVISALMCR